MIRGLYTATTGMMVQRNKMNVLTNNIVNAETTGFKKDNLMSSAFDAVMLERTGDPNLTLLGRTDVGEYSYGSYAQEVITDFTGGDLEETGKSTDLAIVGDGFFAVETADGERYTRGGNFSVNAEGYLMTGDGNYLLGENGRIYVGSQDFTVANDGTITGQLAEEDKLRLVTFGNPENLRKQGNSLYYTYNGEQPIESEASTVRQGMQESSNVDIAEEMVDMITVYRKYEANQKAVTMNDQTLGLAVNKLGRLGV